MGLRALIEARDIGASVRLEGLSKRFGDVVAVDDLTMHVQRGEFLTLLGPSGSGKTSTLMMVAGFEDPTEGEIYIDNTPIVYKPPYKRNIGMVFQNYALFPHLTVHDNVAFPLRMRYVNPREIEERVAAALSLVRLEQYESRYPNMLSGGQQQRIALARALVFLPPVLLMDEPLGALDKKIREHLQIELKHIQRQLNITVIYVTHDQEEALVMSDRVAVMNRGRVEQVGPPEELYERPANHFVADFLGESNFLTGVVTAVEGAWMTVRTDEGLVVRVAHNGSAGVESEVELALRPEKLFFSSIPTEGTGCQGRVEEVIYVGEGWKYKIRYGRQGVLTLKDQNRPGRPRPRPGETASVGWNVEDVRPV